MAGIAIATALLAAALGYGALLWTLAALSGVAVALAYRAGRGTSAAPAPV